MKSLCSKCTLLGDVAAAFASSPLQHSLLASCVYGPRRPIGVGRTVCLRTDTQVVQSTVRTLTATVARYSTAPLHMLTVYCVRARTDRLDADPQAIPQSQFGNYPSRRRLIYCGASSARTNCIVRVEVDFEERLAIGYYR
jgi:hypothetical protein